MPAVAATIGLILVAAATAAVLGWRRYASASAPVTREVAGPSCYPKVQR